MSSATGHEPASLCPRCATELQRDQDWCLRCGSAARTTLASPPNWRIPVAMIAVVAVLCGGALAWAFVALTNNDADVQAATAGATSTQSAGPSTGDTPPGG